MSGLCDCSAQLVFSVKTRFAQEAESSGQAETFTLAESRKVLKREVELGEYPLLQVSTAGFPDSAFET